MKKYIIAQFQDFYDSPSEIEEEDLYYVCANENVRYLVDEIYNDLMDTWDQKNKKWKQIQSLEE